MQKHKRPASVRHLAPATLMLLLVTLTPGVFWWPFAAKTLWLLLGIYSLCILVASVITASARGWKLLPFLPFVFASYHFGYGYGFLYGLCDVILRRHPQKAFVGLTRTSLGNP